MKEEGICLEEESKRNKLKSNYRGGRYLFLEISFYWSNILKDNILFHVAKKQDFAN